MHTALLATNISDSTTALTPDSRDSSANSQLRVLLPYRRRQHHTLPHSSGHFVELAYSPRFFNEAIG